MKHNITFLGGGNMASAITAGLIANGLPPANIHIVQRNLEKAAALQKQYGVTVNQDYEGAIASADVVIFAVKPQGYPDLMKQVEGFLQAHKPIIASIMSGLRIETLEQGNPGLPVIRVMPNTPSRVQSGMTLLTPGALVTEAQLATVQNIFQAVGETVVTPNERTFEQLTALTGCGPAFVYYLVEQFSVAMQAITPDVDCLPLARATFEGALKMLAHDPSLTPEDFIAQVAPKGGMTAEAMKVLRSDDLKKLFKETFEAAIKRGDELA